MKLKKGLLFLLLISLLLLTACSNSSSSNPANGNGKGKKYEGTPVNIGFSGPLSGPAAYYGENILNGMTLAIEEINENGGFEVNGEKYHLNLVSLDDKYLPNETGSNAKRLVQEYNTPIVYVPHSGGIFATQVFNEQLNFIVAAYSSEPDITKQGNDLTIRIPPKYEIYLKPFSEYVMKRFGKKIAFLPTATQYGKDWAEKLEPVWKELGGEVVYKSSIDFTKDTDFFTIVTNALKKNPDVLFIGGPSEPTALVAKQARELGFKGGFLVMDQAKLDEMQAILGDWGMLEGAVSVLPLPYSRNEGNKNFIDDYKKKYGKNPTSEAGYHYYSVYLFVEAMKAAGSTDDPAAIRKHIQKAIDRMPSDKRIYDIRKVEKDGGLVTPFRMGVVEKGKIVNMSEKYKN